jgi:hypothetical protein
MAIYQDVGHEREFAIPNPPSKKALARPRNTCKIRGPQLGYADLLPPNETAITRGACRSSSIALYRDGLAIKLRESEPRKCFVIGVPTSRSRPRSAQTWSRTRTQMRPRPQFREAGPIRLVFEPTAASLFILKALSAISKIARPIDNDAVAAGEGTFHTCSMCSLCTN